MASITATAADVKPLPGALCRRFEAAGDLNAGHAVYLDTAGDVIAADAVTVGHSIAIGIVVADDDGSTTFSDGDFVDVVVFGPCAGFTAASEGSFAYVGTTAGGLADAGPGSGNYDWVVGQSHSTSIIFVNPGMDGVPSQNTS